MALWGALMLGYASQTTLAQPTQAASASSSSPTKTGGTLDTEKIIRTFTQKESMFRRALYEYSFKREAVVQTLGLGGQISGEYHRVSNFVHDDSGKRYEKILFFPIPTLTEISMTPEDLEDMSGVNPFALEGDNAHKYNFTYVGKEKIDELNLYIFDVAPKVMPDPKKSKERLFQGRVWVDEQDLQLVRSRGKGVPEDKNNKYPIFDTYREQIDGRYWFPTYSYSDDELVFSNGRVVRLRARIRFTDFVKLSGKVRVIEEGEPGDVPPTPAPAAPTPPKPKP